MLNPVAKSVIPTQAADLSNGLKYNYEQIAEADRRTVQGAAVEIKAHAERAKTSMLVIGQKLMKIKDLLPHGQFQDWCKIEFEMSQRTAQMMMNAAEVFGSKSETVSLLSDSAMYMLAAPSVPETARIEVIEQAQAQGKSPTKAEVQTIIEQHKPKSETVSLLGQETPLIDIEPPKRLLDLNETIAVIWRVLKHEHAHTSDPNVRLTWLNKHSQIRDYEYVLSVGVKLDFSTFGPAWATVANELRGAIENEQRTKEKAAAQQAKRVESDPPKESPTLSVGEAITNLDGADLMLSSLDTPLTDKAAILLRLYEIVHKSFDDAFKDITSRGPDPVAKIGLQAMIAKLKHTAEKS